jgi:nicotinamide-nucleotide amidase
MTHSWNESVRPQVELLGEHLRRAGWQLGVAESLTGGQLAAAISEGPQAGEWFRGGIVAYQPATKRKLLGVSDGPVVSERCAVEMARGVAAPLDAEVGMALTGVGGPGPAEGQAPGTVWIAVHTPKGELVHLAQLEGRDPAAVCTTSCGLAVRLANEALEIPGQQACSG